MGPSAECGNEPLSAWRHGCQAAVPPTVRTWLNITVVNLYCRHVEIYPAYE